MRVFRSFQTLSRLVLHGQRANVVLWSFNHNYYNLQNIVRVRVRSGHIRQAAVRSLVTGCNRPKSSRKQRLLLPAERDANERAAGAVGGEKDGHLNGRNRKTVHINVVVEREYTRCVSRLDAADINPFSRRVAKRHSRSQTAHVFVVVALAVVQ